MAATPDGKPSYFHEPMDPNEFAWCTKIAREVVESSAIVNLEVNVIAIRQGLNLAYRRGKYCKRVGLTKSVYAGIFISSLIAYLIGFALGRFGV